MLIDTAIRDWVMLPLLLVVALVHFIKVYIMRLVSPEPKPDIKEVAQRNLVARGQRLRANGAYISHQGFHMRKQYLVQGTAQDASSSSSSSSSSAPVGKLKEAVPAAAANPMDQMSGVMPQQAAAFSGLIPMYAINHFLAGFVTLKLPFGLTERFKSITQTGVGVSGLDTSYVSSLSWFYTAQQGFMKLLTLMRWSGMDAAEEARMMQMQAGMMPGMGMPQQQGWQAAAAFKAEDTLVSMAEWSPLPMLRAEQELLQLGRREAGSSRKAD